MIYRLLADVLVVLHIAFVLFAVAGGALVVWRWKWRWAHLPAAAWAAMIEFSGWICPLTPMETWLRERGGQQAYEGSFIAHYIEPILYPPGLTPMHQYLIGTAVIVINVGFYMWAWKRRKANDVSG